MQLLQLQLEKYAPRSFGISHFITTFAAMIRNAIKIVFLGLGLVLFACNHEPLDMGQAAREALENGYAYLEADDDAAAMEAFKDAEHYGLLGGDSLTVSRARYKIGGMLYRKGETKEEYIGRLKAADEGFGVHYDERAKLWNLMGSAYTAFKEYDSAEMCMVQGLEYAEKSQDERVYLAVLTNFFVLNMERGECDKAAEYLWKYKAITGLDSNKRRLYYYRSLGTVYEVAGNVDSASYFRGLIEEMLSSGDTVGANVSYFDYYDLVPYAEARDDYKLALEYYKKFDRGYGRHHRKEEKDNLYAVQIKYNYEVLRNEMNQTIIARQRWIIVISVLSALVLAAFLISQIRLARNRKREAEINAELFHFKRQNQALVQKDAEHEQIQQDYADRLSEALDKEQRVMLLLDNYLNSKRTNLLNDLERSVYGNKDHWKAMLAVVEEKYPGFLETLGQKYPDLDEDEKKSFILSHFKVSRQEEADYFGTTVNMVDKIRGRVRKKMAVGNNS